MSTINNNLEVVKNNNSNVETKEVKKVTSEKDLKVKKDLAIQRSKEQIKNPTSNKLTNEKILDLDFENLDLNNIKSLIKSNVKTKEVTTNVAMYKFERLSLSTEQIKKERSRIRRERNKLSNNILKYFENDLKDNLKKEIVLFNKFYKETYLLNDYSINSIAKAHSDKDNLVKLNLMLQIIKKVK